MEFRILGSLEVLGEDGPIVLTPRRSAPAPVIQAGGRAGRRQGARTAEAAG
jgi:hypothetical protein